MSAQLSNSKPEAVSEKVRPLTRLLRNRRENAGYKVRFAVSREDLRNAQALRFLVFNLELSHGAEAAFHRCLDEDEFDAACSHLLVEHEATGEVVGTYRLQTGLTAALNHGYYSAREFDFTPFEPMRGFILELGRACVRKDHRNLHVLTLLWKGIADFARTHEARYLIGCSSLNSVNPAEGISLYNQLMKRRLAPDEWLTSPMPGWECPQEEIAPVCPAIPKLLSAYLSIGATICGPPALDKEFGTIDYLTLLDLRGVELPG